LVVRVLQGVTLREERSNSECGKNDKKGICTGSKEFEFLIKKNN
jgi:hypothetical protein